MILKRTPRHGKRTGSRVTSVSSQSVLTAMATLMSRGAGILALIVLTPLLFAGLGERLFGVYQLTQRIAQFGGLTNLGATSYLKIRLAEMSRDAEFGERRKALADCLLQWSAMLPIMVAWTAAAVYAVNARSGLTSGELAAIAVLVLLTPFRQIIGVGQVALFTHGRGYFGITLSTTIGIASSVCAALAAYWGYGIVGVAIALAAGAIFDGLTGLLLASRLLPWFGLQWPSFAEFRDGFGKSWGASLASLGYLGLQQVETLTVGFAAGPNMLSRFVLTCIGIQVLDILIRSFIGTAAYGIAPFIRERRSDRVRELRAEAHGNIMAVFMLSAPPIIFLTPLVVAQWIPTATVLGPSVGAAVLLLAMFRLLSVFDSALLDQARDFYAKIGAAIAVVFIPCTGVGIAAAAGLLFDGWIWLVSAAMATYFLLVARRVASVLDVGNSWSVLLLPVANILFSLGLADTEAARTNGTAFVLLFALSCVAAFAGLLHPALRRPALTSWNRLRRLLRDLGSRKGDESPAA